MRVFSTNILVLGALATSCSLSNSGCSSDGGKPQSIASDERVGQIVEMRKIFDKVGGKWDDLTPEDKATYTRFAGDEAKAQTMWKGMAAPPGASQGG